MFSKHMTHQFDQGIGTKHILKEVMEFLNLVKLGVAQCENVGYYERKLNFFIGYQKAPCVMFLVF